ncbi:aminotransferase A [Virgibacillus halodenitrificans]|uniref:aminotransferase A n=1 Tax=Virgibacillus halodenitrificans TaxID=1482 RepID=UPI000760F580
MEYLLNKKIQQIEISGIRQFFNLVSGEENVVSLTIGQPDFHTPKHVRMAASQALADNKTTYTHNAGIIDLRKAISKFNEEKYHLLYNPENEIIVTAGASQAIDITFRAILNPNDEVILPGPIYPGYEPLIKLAGATPVYADTTSNGFKLSKEILKRHINERTKCVVLPYPSNPTGASYTTTELKELVSILKDKNIFVLADEIYSELIYEEPHTSIASFPEMKEKTIVVNGVSKSHSMTGFRIGYVLAPKWISNHMLKVHQYNVSCASSISQYAALEALTNGKNDAIQMREVYRKRRDYVYSRLLSFGLEVDCPKGAFYIFPKFPITEMNSFDLGIDLVRKGKIALVPGSSFSPLGEGYMRLSYAYELNTIERGLNRLDDYLQKGYLR